MNIIITPQQMGSTEVNTVDARELHAHLGVKKDFSNWIKPKLADAMLDEGVDYITHTQKGVGGKFDSKNYILSIDTAKHIAMMSRTAKGKEVRAYFIEVEKRSRETVTINPIDKEMLKVLDGLGTALNGMAKGMESMAGAVGGLENRVKALEGKATNTHIHITPPTKAQIDAKRTSIRLQMLKNLVEINPGINQSQLMGLAGYRRDDKGIIKLLKDMQGVLWEVLPYSGQWLYYPLPTE